MSKSFENNWRRKQEIKMRPVADKLYRSIFGNLFGEVGIYRPEHEDDYILDREFAIDTILTLPGGQILTMQEKFLSSKYSGYRTVTVEYEQNQHTGEHGDWYKLASQLYFCGYITEDNNGFHPWVLLDWPATVLSTQLNQIQWQDNSNKDGRAMASFKFTVMDNLPDNAVVAKEL